MNENKSAFPYLHRWGPDARYETECGRGITAKQYAAIHLRVPRSGDLELDAMIRESRRAEFAERALVIAANWFNVGANREPIAALAFEFADAMLAKWEAGK
jgi:hypothetical protein